MKNKQTGVSKILFISATLFLTVIFHAHAQNALSKADSLFRAKQYLQSFDLYHRFYQSGSYSPAMLLKMAYIQEGLGHISQSIYYLQLYYQATADEQALRKIEELATKNKLEGYTSDSDQTFFRSLADQFSLQVSGVLLALVLFFFALVIYKKRKSKERPIWAGFLLLFFLALLFAQTNFLKETTHGIVSETTTYLMSGPSAGASVVAIIGEGHQLKIKGQKDVWLRVEWADKEAYIKENKLLRAEL
jgi:hypothetical protein